MPAPQVPAVLTGKLQFGNQDQITALNDYTKKHQEYYGDGTTKPYLVFVEYSETISVMAKSGKQAEDLARLELKFMNTRDFDVTAELDRDSDC